MSRSLSSLLFLIATVGIALVCNSWWAGRSHETEETIPRNAGLTSWPVHDGEQTQAECKSHLKQIGLALRQYHEKFETFPPAYVQGPDGRSWHSWRVLLLPFLGEESLYSEYRLNEPWNSEHNQRLSLRVPECYRCPMETKKGAASYFAIVSRRTMWPAYFSVRINDVIDGTSNTVQLVEAPDRDINWLEPRDLTLAQAVELIHRNERHRILEKGEYVLTQHGEEWLPRDEHHGIHHVLFADGTVHTVKTNIAREIWSSCLTPVCQGSIIPLDQWPSKLLADEQLEGGDFGPETDSASLTGVRFVATPDENIDGKSTVLWCATMQMAWDHFRRLLQVAEVPVRDSPDIAVRLNARRFPLNALAKNSYGLRVEGIGTEEAEKLLEGVASKYFKHNPDRTELPSANVGAFRITASLHKQLPFEFPFDRLQTPLRFHGSDVTADVNAFGRLPFSSSKFDEQVVVHDYVSDDDFVIEIIASNPQRDRLLLAKVPPAPTLEATWRAVVRRKSRISSFSEGSRLRAEDEFAVPVLRCNLKASFDDLEGRIIEVDPELTLAVARQTIRFRLDERGAELLSFADLENIGADGDPPPPKPRHFRFDKPFFLALQESQGAEPYFLAWITATSLMERSALGKMP